MKTWTEDTWTPWRQSRRVVHWVGPGGEGIGMDPAEGQIGAPGFSMGGNPDVVGMDVAAGMVPAGTGFWGNALYGLTHQNPMVFSIAFNQGIQAGLDPSSAASYAASMAMPAPNLAGIRGAQNFGLGAMLGPISLKLGIPNLMAFANKAAGRFGTSVADIMGLPTSQISPTMPGMTPGAGGPGAYGYSMNQNRFPQGTNVLSALRSALPSMRTPTRR